jgi:hypothetical protein
LSMEIGRLGTEWRADVDVRLNSLSSPAEQYQKYLKYGCHSRLAPTLSSGMIQSGVQNTLTGFPPKTGGNDSRGQDGIFEMASEQNVVKKDTTANSNWREPPFKLVRIMQKDKLTTAVLQRDDGATFFVRKGDTLAGAKILSLDQQIVEYAYRGQRKE